MIKYEYKVLKGFAIYKDEEGKVRLARTDEEREGSSKFEKNDNYVDYEFPEKAVKQDKLTKSLVRRRYIKLVKRSESEQGED